MFKNDASSSSSFCLQENEMTTCQPESIAFEQKGKKNSDFQENEAEENSNQQIVCKGVVKKRHRIKKAKWNLMPLYQPLKEKGSLFYLYGSFVILSEYTSETFWESDYYQIIQRYQLIQQVELSKQRLTVETTFSSHQSGLLDFSFLINLFERKQHQGYYEIAQGLKEFSKFVNGVNKQIIINQKQIKELPDIFDRLEQQFQFFENWTEKFAQKHLSEEFYSYSLFRINYQKGFAELKKQIYSQNLIFLIGSTLEESLETEIFKMRHKNVQVNRNEEISMDEIIQYISRQLKFSAKQFRSVSSPFKLQTLEGFIIPAVIENRLIQLSDFKDEFPELLFLDPKDYQMYINIIKIDPIWLKRLIDLRSELNGLMVCSDEGQITSIDYSLSQYNLQNDFMEEKQKNADSSCSEVIDLVADHNFHLQTVMLSRKQQKAEQEKMLQCAQLYKTLRTQAKELQNLEYSCQVEFLIEKFYNQQGMRCHFKCKQN